MNKPNGSGIARIFKATQCSIAGLRQAWQHEAAFRQELVLGLILFPFSFWLAESGFEWGILVASLLLVLIVELVNSAIEAAIDRIGLERHPLSGRAKDLGSAAVTLSLLIVVCIWGGLLWQKLA